MVHYTKFGRKGFSRFKEGGKSLHKREVDKVTSKVSDEEKAFDSKKPKHKAKQPTNL